MTYLEHSIRSAAKFGGKPEDYMYLHKLMDSSKFYHGNFQHRLFSHNTWFVEKVCELYGDVIQNSDGKLIMVRDILYQHLIEDHGKVVTIQDWCKILTLKDVSWLNNPR